MTLPAGIQDAIQKRMVLDGADQGFFGYKSWYPLQLTEKPAGEENHGSDQRATYYGEIRGYYPGGGGYFQPWNSTFHAASFQDPKVPAILRHRKHKGFDLYAPYLPWPLEIPVYALVNGELSQRSQHSNWNSLGNRADLSFSVKVGGKTHVIVLSYGHLARFAPVPEGRKMWDATIFEVKAGDLIGFIGKSGNADRDQESSKKELKFGVNAAHIHISVRTGSTTHDPYPILNKRFGYHPDRDELFPDDPGDPKKSKGRQYLRSDFADKRLRPENDLPYIKDFSAGFDIGTRAGMRIAEQPKNEKETRPSRVPFPGVYRAIDTNNTHHLRATQKAYALAEARLDSDKTSDVEHVRYALFGPNTGEPLREPWFKAYLEKQDPAVWGDTLGDSLDRAKSHAARMAAVPSGSRAPYAAAMLLSLHEAIWILMFGPLISGLCRQWAFAKDGAEPQTGIGIRGQVMATRYHETVGALHVASLKGTSVFSVTCGSGSLRHATFPEPSKFTDAQAKAYAYGVLKDVFWATRVLHAVIRLSADRLEPEKDNELVAKVRARVTAIAVKAMALGDKATGYLDDTKVEGFRDNLLKVLVSNNAALFAEATKLSRHEDTSTGPPHQPNLEWVGHIGGVAWSKETGGLRYE